MIRAANLLLGLGCFMPAAAWFATQQSQGAVLYYDCQAGGSPIGPLLGLAGVIACLVGGWLGWRRRADAPTPTGRFMASLTPGLAGLFALANLFTLTAAWLIPSCAR